MTRAVVIPICLLAALSTDPVVAADLVPDPPIDCEPCAGWNRPQEPFRVFGNTYSVGPAGLSAVLIASDDGHVLIDGALPQSAPLIAENLEALGFNLEDVRLILNSHAHFDHAGGIAALQRASGATVAASAEGAAALERGDLLPDDPQHGLEESAFPAVESVRVVEDGKVLRVGELAVTAHRTPGHTPGGTTWTWRSCEGKRCLDVVYADSLTAVSAPGFRFLGTESAPGIASTFRESIAKIATLPCDVLLATHPGTVDLEGKLQRRRQDPETNPFIDPDACRRYAERAAEGLARRLSEEAEAEPGETEPQAHQADPGAGLAVDGRDRRE